MCGPQWINARAIAVLALQFKIYNVEGDKLLVKKIIQVQLF